MSVFTPNPKYQKYICLLDNFTKIDKNYLTEKLYRQTLLGPAAPGDRTTRISPDGEPDINWKILPEEIKKTEEKVLALIGKITGHNAVRFIFSQSPFSTRKKIVGFVINLDREEGNGEQEVLLCSLPPKLLAKICSAVNSS